MMQQNMNNQWYLWCEQLKNEKIDNDPVRSYDTRTIKPICDKYGLNRSAWLCGHVKNRNGDLIPNAPLELLECVNGKCKKIAETTADANGYYVISLKKVNDDAIYKVVIKKKYYCNH